MTSALIFFPTLLVIWLQLNQMLHLMFPRKLSWIHTRDVRNQGTRNFSGVKHVKNTVIIHFAFIFLCELVYWGWGLGGTHSGHTQHAYGG